MALKAPHEVEESEDTFIRAYWKLIKSLTASHTKEIIEEDEDKNEDEDKDEDKDNLIDTTSLVNATVGSKSTEEVFYINGNTIFFDKLANKEAILDLGYSFEEKVTKMTTSYFKPTKIHRAILPLNIRLLRIKILSKLSA